MFQIAGNIELLGKKFWRRREKQTYETVALGLNANFSDHWQVRNHIGKKKHLLSIPARISGEDEEGEGRSFYFLICL